MQSCFSFLTSSHLIHARPLSSIFRPKKALAFNYSSTNSLFSLPKPRHFSMSPASSESSRARVARKRIIVACDGTWQDADSNAERDYPWYQRPFNTAEHLVAPSNVTRLCRSIAREGTDESGEVIPQIVYYQSGIGSQNWMSAHIIGGATGRGISSNIRE